MISVDYTIVNLKKNTCDQKMFKTKLTQRLNSASFTMAIYSNQLDGYKCLLY